MHVPFYSAPSDVIPWDNCTGQSAKRTLVLVVQTDIPGQLALLKKILRAVDLDFDSDIAFLTMDQNAHVLLLPDPHLSKFENVITFGLDPAHIGLPAVDERAPAVLQFEKLTWLWAPSLTVIAGNAGLKKQLWNALKDVFEPTAP